MDFDENAARAINIILLLDLKFCWLIKIPVAHV